MVDAELLEELRGLRAAIERLPDAIAAAMRSPGDRPLRESDVERLKRLLPLVAEGWWGALFVVRDLWDDAPVAVSRDRLLIELGDRNQARALGRLLARAADRNIGGFAVRRATRLREGQTWHVERLSGSRGDE